MYKTVFCGQVYTLAATQHNFVHIEERESSACSLSQATLFLKMPNSVTH